MVATAADTVNNAATTTGIQTAPEITETKISLIEMIMKGGPRLGIDFKGGSLVQVAFKTDVPMKELRSVLAGAGYADAEIQGQVVGGLEIVLEERAKAPVTLTPTAAIALAFALA